MIISVDDAGQSDLLPQRCDNLVLDRSRHPHVDVEDAPDLADALGPLLALAPVLEVRRVGIVYHQVCDVPLSASPSRRCGGDHESAALVLPEPSLLLLPLVPIASPKSSDAPLPVLLPQSLRQLDHVVVVAD